MIPCLRLRLRSSVRCVYHSCIFQMSIGCKSTTTVVECGILHDTIPQSGGSAQSLNPKCHQSFSLSTLRRVDRFCQLQEGDAPHIEGIFCMKGSVLFLVDNHNVYKKNGHRRMHHVSECARATMLITTAVHRSEPDRGLRPFLTLGDVALGQPLAH